MNRRSWLPVVLVTGVLLYVADTAPAAPDEVRGTWLTTTGVDHIKGGLNTPGVMQDLRDIGLNTVYVESWKNGYTNFPSSTLATFTGSVDRSTFLGSRDLVDETVIHAHRQGLNYFAWFEYGFAAQFVGAGGTPSNPLASKMRTNGWLLEDQAGQYGNSSNGFAWMNPAVPEVRQLLIDITLEAVERYDLDGVQFDDRLAWPREFGWDSTTAAYYLAETGRSLPTNVDDSRFRAWRQSKVTLFAEELTAAIRDRRPQLQLSISPSITSFSDNQYNAVWPDWQDADLFDEYAVQVYRNNIGSFNSTIGSQVAEFASNELDQLVVGLRGGTASAGSETPYAELEAMIERTRQEGAAGHSIFFSYTVRDVYGSELTAFYDVAANGLAASPIFGADWREEAIVGVPDVDTSDAWHFEVPHGGRYRVVGKVGNFWQELQTLPLAAGPIELDLGGVEQAELLIDRRPLALPDFDGNGVVDITDYTLWRDTLGSTTDLRADFDNDLVVGAGDYAAWKSHYGAVAAATASGLSVRPIPEPAARVLAAAIFAMFAVAMSRMRLRVSRCRDAPNVAERIAIPPRSLLERAT